jgi:hypothetical protein
MQAMNASKQSRRIMTRARSIVYGLINAATAALESLTALRKQTILAFGQWVGLFVFGLAIVLLLWNSLIRYEHLMSDQSQDVLLLASYPRYLAIDDQGGLVITVANIGQHPITDTVVSVIYGNVDYVSMDIDSTSRVHFDHLEPNERKTKLVRFQVNHIDSVIQKAPIDLQLSAQHSTTVTTTVHIEPTILSFLPIGASSLALNRAVSIPNLVVAVAAIAAFSKSVGETFKLFRELRSSGSRKQPSSRA